jgi:hypothetical protein
MFNINKNKNMHDERMNDVHINKCFLNKYLHINNFLCPHYYIVFSIFYLYIFNNKSNEMTMN